MKTEDFKLYGKWIETTPKRMACVLVHDERGRLLMQLRDDFEGLKGAGLWSLFGGEIEAGEGILEACIREAREEIGIEFAPQDLAPHLRYISQGSHDQFFVFFSKRRIAPHEITLGEGAGFAFLNTHQVMNFDISISVKELVQAHILSWKGEK